MPSHRSLVSQASGPNGSGLITRSPSTVLMPACFTCATCPTVLDGAYTEHGGKPYCAPCWKKTRNEVAQKCAGCGEAVSGQALRVDTSSFKGTFHPACFNCGGCGGKHLFRRLGQSPRHQRRVLGLEPVPLAPVHFKTSPFDLEP